MILKQIENMSYRIKKTLVNDIFIFYKKISISKVYVDSHVGRLNDSIIDRDSLANLKSLSLFKTILVLMDEDEAKIIKNDFITDNKYWWEESWSKSTYYKKRRSAINNFLYLFYG